MRNLLIIISIIFSISVYSEVKQTKAIQTRSDSILSLPQSVKYEVFGFILKPKIAIYDSSLKEIDSLIISEDIAIVDILEKTKDMITASGDTLNDPCPTANFLKIRYNNKEYIAYGTDIYEAIKKEFFNLKNDINSISLYALKNFSIGFSGFGELTGCDDYHPLIVFEDNQFHKIYTIPRKDFDYYAKNNNLDYYYLTSDDGTRESIEKVSLNNDTIIAKIRVEYQDGYSYYDLNITKNNGTFKSTISNETEIRFDD